LTGLRPSLVPVGDAALLVRLSDRIGDEANVAAIAMGKALMQKPLPGVVEIAPNLVSVLVRYDPLTTTFNEVAGLIRLILLSERGDVAQAAPEHEITVRFGGEQGPDLAAVAASLDMSEAEFIHAHNARPLRVLATGFAPGFVYCGFHPEHLVVPRRRQVRRRIEPGSLLFAAGQTAITATPIPTGWSVIGITPFRNFDPSSTPPTRLAPGDIVRFTEVKP